MNPPAAPSFCGVRPRAAQPVAQPASRVASAPGARGRPPTAGRRLLADYLTDARAALDTARAAGEPVEVTAAWCRRVTGCSAGTSVKVAAALRAPRHREHPAYPCPAYPCPACSWFVCAP